MSARLRPPIAALAAAAPLLVLPAPAGAGPVVHAAVAGPAQARYAAGEVIVRFAAGAGPATRTAAERAAGVGAPTAVAPDTSGAHVAGGAGVPAPIRALRAQPGVLRATPNFVARLSSGWIPQDPGRSHRRAA